MELRRLSPAPGVYLPVSLDSADLNGDSFQDIVIVGGSSGGILTILNNTDETFTWNRVWMLQASVNYVVTGDFNNDNKPDFVVAADIPDTENDSLGFFLNDGSGSEFANEEYSACSAPNSINAEDFNLDSTTDFVVACEDKILRLYKGEGASLDYDRHELSADAEHPFSFVQAGDFQHPIDFVPTPRVSYALWNGFLEMTNILELVNNSDSEKTATIELYTITGELGVRQDITLARKEQLDIILNDLPGFSKDSYGILQITGEVTGRLFYYRTNGSGFESFEYAFGIPLLSAMSGVSAVGFNTFQPSTNPNDAGNLVANWLSVVNLSSKQEIFTIRKYNQDGELLSEDRVPIPAFGRTDLDGGHMNPGPSHVGLISIIPENDEASYLAQLMRYGSSSSGGYDFAFPLIAKSGIGKPTFVPLSSNLNAQNWLEVVNTTGEDLDIALDFYNSSGEKLSTITDALSPYSQKHYNSTAILGDDSGYAMIEGSRTSSLIAQSMFYFRDSASGSILSMYGTQARESFAPNVTGSFNLFLEMDNYLNLINISDLEATLTISITSNFSAGSEREITIPAHSRIDLGLHDTKTFGTAVNAYGAVTISPEVFGQVISEIVRVHRSPSSGVLDFVAPTQLR